MTQSITLRTSNPKAGANPTTFEITTLMLYVVGWSVFTSDKK
jgi:hypothetical protein